MVQENEDGLLMVDGPLPFAETAFLCEMNRAEIVGINDAASGFSRVMLSKPALRGLDGLLRIASAVKLRSEYPTHFREANQRRLEFAHLLGITDFADKSAGSLFFDSPEPVFHPEPVACVAKQSRPGFFPRPRFAADEAVNGRRGPQSDGLLKVSPVMAAKAQTRSFDDRNRRDH